MQKNYFFFKLWFLVQCWHVLCSMFAKARDPKKWSFLVLTCGNKGIPTVTRSKTTKSVHILSDNRTMFSFPRACRQMALDIIPIAAIIETVTGSLKWIYCRCKHLLLIMEINDQFVWQPELPWVPCLSPQCPQWEAAAIWSQWLHPVLLRLAQMAAMNTTLTAVVD